jgi:signal transduction histidine kinase
VPTELPAVVGDRALLRRVLVNLVVNALRHSGSDEVRVEGTPGPGPADVSLRVIDRGHGIPEAEQARVFEKFRTVRRSPVDDPSGDTGLGLPFCKLAVERMGGRISLTSTPGVATVFTIVLPIHVATR